jgi:hypothetical protein
MSKRHKRRMEARAVAALAMIAEQGRHGATALDVGAVVTAKWTRRMSDADKEVLGLATGARLVRDGLVVVTRGNRFMLTRFDGKAVPPPVRVEDMPAPGFSRVPAP